MTRHASAGFVSLVEVCLGALILAIVAAAVFGTYVGQMTLNEHARNLWLTMQDANRVIERIRQQNVGCATPSVTPPGPTSWDAWLQAQNPGKSVVSTTPNTDELIVITCSHRDGPAFGRCGDTNQVGTGEWAAGKQGGVTTNFNPLRVTVAVCWRQRGRVIGECTWNGAALAADDTVTVTPDTVNVIDSPTMLTTLVTCR